MGRHTAAQTERNRFLESAHAEVYRRIEAHADFPIPEDTPPLAGADLIFPVVHLEPETAS